MIDNTYKRRYKLRAVGQDGLNIIVSMPRVVVEREAERQGLTVGEFLKQFKAVAQYNNFEGIMYTFEEIKQREAVLTGPINVQREK